MKKKKKLRKKKRCDKILKQVQLLIYQKLTYFWFYFFQGFKCPCRQNLNNYKNKNRKSLIPVFLDIRFRY